MTDSSILHVGLVRVRVVGTGNLDGDLRSLDDVVITSIGALTMQATNSRKMDRLCNFIQQGARLKLGTDSINEYFKINDITIYVKPIYTQYPG